MKYHHDPEYFEIFLDSFYRRSLWRYLGFGFMSTFALGIAFIFIVTTVSLLLCWVGFSNPLGEFINAEYRVLEFYLNLSYALIIAIIALALTNREYWAALNYLQLNDAEIRRYLENKKRKKSFIEKYIDDPIKISLALTYKFLSRPSGIVIVLIALIILFNFIWSDIYNWLGLKEEPTSPESFRNRGFALAAFVGFFITAFGIALTIWGRIQTHKQTEQTQKQIKQSKQQIKLSREANASERYENAARMLGNDVLAVRIAGFHTLENLGSSDIENQPIVVRCMNLLAAYISNPYFDEDEKKVIKKCTSVKKSKLEALFDAKKELRADIQLVANSISAIYQSHKSYKLNKPLQLTQAKLNLPSYFWNNIKKNTVQFPHACLAESNLRSAYLFGANLAYCDLHRTDLSKANLSNAHLFEASFTGANLERANLTKAFLPDAILSYANLSKANLSQASFTRADLKEAKLIMADLSMAYLGEANLTSANLEKANLSEVNLSGAILSKANLSNVNLTNADLSGADMSTSKNLTKGQVLSATWGYCRFEYDVYPRYGTPIAPKLPESFLKDKNIRKWLKEPHHNKHYDEEMRILSEMNVGEYAKF